MTCGLEWKNEIGRLIKTGMNKQEIMNYFIAQYGEEARLTPRQKIDGKIYQYTRDFDTVDWVLLWAGIGAWIVCFLVPTLMFPSWCFLGSMQGAVRREWRALAKGCNAAVAPLRGSRLNAHARRCTSSQ